MCRRLDEMRHSPYGNPVERERMQQQDDDVHLNPGRMYQTPEDVWQSLDGLQRGADGLHPPSNAFIICVFGKPHCALEDDLNTLLIPTVP